jgi:hypothetical protein
MILRLTISPRWHSARAEGGRSFIEFSDPKEEAEFRRLCRLAKESSGAAGSANQVPTTPTSVASGGEPSLEIGGPQGPEPTRYGDWERNGRVTDF